VLDSGCCGMAGAFGYDKGERYQVSVAAGERVLLPAVHKAERDTLIVSNGFSCCGQISQCTGRQALHLAQVVQLALRNGRNSDGGTAVTGTAEVRPARLVSAAAAMVAGAVAGSLVAARVSQGGKS
jgi:hypothetical protein